MSVNADEFNSAAKEKDIFLYEKVNLVKKKSNSNKNKLIEAEDSKILRKKKEKINWNKCLKKTSPIERTRFCNNEFHSSVGLKRKCEVNFLFKKSKIFVMFAVKDMFLGCIKIIFIPVKNSAER